MITESFESTNGVRLHVLSAGPETGPLVILLHGFPEGAFAWRSQMEKLAHAGFRVLAPDQRGYGQSDKPKPVSAYALPELSQDIIGLIDSAGRKTASIVGHDWGGSVAWSLAQHSPTRIERAVILNCPHVSVMGRAFRTSPRQLARSWYMFFFLLPELPEKLLASRNSFMAARGMKKSSRPGTFTGQDLERYRQAWSEPGAWHAMLNWYRAGLQRLGGQTRSPAAPRSPIPTPTLLIWGTEDKFLGRELAQASVDRCAQGRVEFVQNAGHWVHHEQPEKVNELILAFLPHSH